MKTNVPIETTDAEREAIAYTIDSQGGVWPNQRKRKVTRAEIVMICQQHIGGLAGFGSGGSVVVRPRQPESNSLFEIDPGDRELMARPDDPGYVRGWNLVKRGAA